ncbi:MAG: hypothetical protein IPM57_04475 [Oligoflexia bacterium]|nr:hypothetical protein [Oligoflexia bacterium]
MASFFSKLFGQKNKLEGQISDALEGVIQKGGFDLKYSIEKKEEDKLIINFSGPDAALLTDRDGLVLDSFEIYLKRIIQNKGQEQIKEIIVDCDGYLEATAEELKNLAEKLKNMALQKGQATYMRPLPPRDRKTVHRHIAEDARVKSQSIGEGFCKKIKITPVGIERKNNRNFNRRHNRESDQGV